MCTEKSLCHRSARGADIITRQKVGGIGTATMMNQRRLLLNPALLPRLRIRIHPTYDAI